MLIDRPQVVEGSSIQNVSIAIGASFPPSPNAGELFYLTSGSTGLYCYNGSAWDLSTVESKLNEVISVNTQQSSDILALQSSQNTGQNSLQTQLDAHVADDTRHLTPSQNTLLDGISVDFTQINKLVGLTAYLGSNTLATQLSSLDSNKLNVSGSNNMVGALNLGGNKIINVGTPTVASDAANKDYVDSFVQGLHWVGSVRVTTISDITLSGIQVIDGITITSGDRILVKNQTDARQNGIWIAASSAWSRANDFNSALEVNNSAVFVLEGTTQGKSTWIQLSTVATVGGDPTTWTAFSGPVINSAGPGILLGTGGQVSVVEGAGIAFNGNALVADVMPSSGLMTTTDGVNASTAANAQLSLTNVGTPGTYRSITTDSKGRITAGTNPTTLSGYGITDAVNKAGDTMTGSLNINNTEFRATTPLLNTAWWVSPPYGPTGQGDQRTHFGYNTGSGFVNYIRGDSTIMNGGLDVGGSLTVTGSPVWTQSSLTNNNQLTNGAGYLTASSALTWASITSKPSRTAWTASDANNVVVGQLTWRKFGDAHTIFDASNGVTPTGAACSATDAATPWAVSYPMLVGYNGAGTYGVRVDSARIADAASTLATNATLTGTTSVTRILAGNGTPAAPSYSFTSDSDSGIYSTGDGFRFSVNGAYMANFGVGGHLSITGNFYGGGAGLTGTALNLTSGSTNGLSETARGTTMLWNAVQNFVSAKGATYLGTQTNYTLNAYSGDGGAAAMSFLRGGSYGVNMGLDPDNVFRIGGWSAPSNRLQMDMSGNLTMFGDVTAYSDERLKTNWRDVTASFIDKWANIKHGVFERTDSGATQIGLSAQSVQQIVPEAVSEMADGYLTINYGAVSAVATVKLAEEVIELRKQLQMQGELIKLLMEKQGI